jgi:hypothetical protein
MIVPMGSLARPFGDGANFSGGRFETSGAYLDQDPLRHGLLKYIPDIAVSPTNQSKNTLSGHLSRLYR